MKTTINTCIMITVNNPSAAVMEYLAKLPSIDANTDVTIGSTPVPDTPQQSTRPDPQDTALRIASVADIDNYLDIGTEVHWRGAKFVFDGVVEQINDSALGDEDGNVDALLDAKAIFIRRNDTDKLVSLTLRDLQTSRLTLID
jgi:hypothetical protein